MAITKIYKGKEYQLVEVTECLGGWPVGTIGWLLRGTDQVYNSDFSERWYHDLGYSCELVEGKDKLKKIEHLDVDPADNCAFVNVWGTSQAVNVVIGASKENCCASLFGKSNLRKLIKFLEGVAEEMERD